MKLFWTALLVFSFSNLLGFGFVVSWKTTETSKVWGPENNILDSSSCTVLKLFVWKYALYLHLKEQFAFFRFLLEKHFYLFSWAVLNDNIHASLMSVCYRWSLRQQVLSLACRVEMGNSKPDCDKKAGWQIVFHFDKPGMIPALTFAM